MESGGGGSSNSDNNNNNNGSALIAESTGYSKRAGTTTTVSSSTSLSRYESQKRRDWNTFGQYLRNHRPPLGLPRCNSAHVLEFLRYLDQFGKTKIHVPGCPFFGQPNPPAPCACPLRQAWGSLDALIGRLRAAFEEHGGQPETNPFGARAVRIFLREVRDLQAKARGITYEKKKRKRPPYPTSLTGVTPPPQPSPQTTTVAMMSSTTSPPLAPPPPHQVCYRPQTTVMKSSTTSSPPRTAVMLTSSVTLPPCLTTGLTSPPLPFLHPQFSHPSLMMSSQQFGVPQFQLPYSYHSHMKLPVGLTRPTQPNQFPW